MRSTSRSGTTSAARTRPPCSAARWRSAALLMLARERGRARHAPARVAAAARAPGGGRARLLEHARAAGLFGLRAARAAGAGRPRPGREPRRRRGAGPGARRACSPASLFYFHYVPGPARRRPRRRGRARPLPRASRFFIFHNESRQSLRLWALGFWMPAAGRDCSRRRSRSGARAPAARPVLAAWLARGRSSWCSRSRCCSRSCCAGRRRTSSSRRCSCLLSPRRARRCRGAGVRLRALGAVAGRRALAASCATSRTTRTACGCKPHPTRVARERCGIIVVF